MQRQHQVEQRIILKNVRQQIQLQENNEGKKKSKNNFKSKFIL